MMASELVPIELRQGEEVVWQNKLVNSPYGICPLRLSFEKETHGAYFLFHFLFNFNVVNFLLIKGDVYPTSRKCVAQFLP